MSLTVVTVISLQSLFVIFCLEVDVCATLPGTPGVRTAGGRGEGGDEEEEKDDEVEAEAVQAGGRQQGHQQPRHRAQLHSHPPPPAAVHVLRGHGSLMFVCRVTVHCEEERTLVHWCQPSCCSLHPGIMETGIDHIITRLSLYICKIF